MHFFLQRKIKYSNIQITMKQIPQIYFIVSHLSTSFHLNQPFHLNQKKTEPTPLGFFKFQIYIKNFKKKKKFMKHREFTKKRKTSYNNKKEREKTDD